MPYKNEIINNFKDHVSRGKAEFFSKFGMDFVMGRREGPWLWDIDDKKRLYNLHSNGGVFNLGHRNGELIAILKESLDSLDIGNHHLMSRERANCAKKLSDLMPGDLNIAIFGVSGGESVDLSIKIARGATGKNKIISVKGGYHGHTGLALLAGDSKYRKPFNINNPGFVQVPFGNVDALKNEIDNDTAAIILEPIPATLGIALPPEGYLEAVSAACKEHDVLLIMDEVQTGLGRTGRLWAFEHYNIIPDIVVIGKGLSGGIYPITATIIREKYDKIFREDPFIHVSTFGGSELGCRIANKVLDISSAESFLAQVEKMGSELEKSLGPLLKKHNKFFKGIRRKGLMMGLELRDELAGPVLTKTAYDNDLLLIYANNDSSICQMLPPLTVSAEDIEFITTSLDKAMGKARQLLPVLKIKRKISSIF